MPVVPNFSSYAPTPNLAQSYLGGARLQADIMQHAQALQFQRQKLAQDAQQAEMELMAKQQIAKDETQADIMQHAQALQFQRQKLAQDAQQAEMELMAKQQIAKDETLRRQQEMEIEKSYKQAQIGLEQQKMKESEQLFKFKTDQAAQQLVIQQMAQARIAKGEDATRVWQELGPQAGMHLPAGLFRTPPPSARIMNVHGGLYRVPTGDAGIPEQLIAPPPQREPTPFTYTTPGKGEEPSMTEHLTRAENAARQKEQNRKKAEPLIDEYKENEAEIKNGDLHTGFLNYRNRINRNKEIVSELRALGFEVPGPTKNVVPVESVATSGTTTNFVWDAKSNKLIRKGQ